ncbi:MAG TPA: ferredoxin [Acidimicrobiales bacterium]|jgi:ferredoxin|nr:ferredoxin [Acidimicrobiales bacterium]
MRVVIDSDRCTGHGRCYALAPELFTDDDSGYGEVIGDGTVSPDQRAAAERAVAGCPERAITLED